MLIPTEIIYDAGPLRKATLGLKTWNAIVGGTTTEMYLWVDEFVGSFLAKASFNIRKNGVPLFPTSQRFEIGYFTLHEDPVLYVAKTGLSIPTALGDEFSLDLERVERTALYFSPITFLMRTQEEA